MDCSTRMGTDKGLKQHTKKQTTNRALCAVVCLSTQKLTKILVCGIQSIMKSSEKKKRIMLIGYIIIAIGALVVLQHYEPTPTVGGIPAPKKFTTYENQSLGISFQYPENYIQTEETMYPIPLVTFVSAPECVGEDIWWGYDEKFEDCFVLNVWQQEVPYNLNMDYFSKYGSIYFGDTRGTTKTRKTNSGFEINTVQIPRLNKQKEVAGELIMQYIYNQKNTKVGSKVFKTILRNVQGSSDYIAVQPQPCCTESTPSMVIQRYGGTHHLRVYHLLGSDLKKIQYHKEDGITIGHPKTSPDGNKVALPYWHTKEHTNGPEGFDPPTETGITIIHTNAPYTATQIIKPEKDTHSHLSWSPDSRYISYMIDYGEGVGMMDTTTKKEVFRFHATKNDYERYERGDIASVGGQPVVWINNNEFGVLYNGTLYLGTPTNPKQRIIAENINKSGMQYYKLKGRPSFYAHFLSPDGRYVVYRASDSAIMQDIETGKKYPFGRWDDGSDGGKQEPNWRNEGWSIREEIGWTKENKLLFNEDGILKQASVKDGILIIEEIVDLAPFGHEATLIENGPYLLLYGDSPPEPIIVYNIDTQSQICPNLHMLHYYTSAVAPDGNIYVVANPTHPRFPQSMDNQRNIRRQNEKMLEVFNITRCESVGGFMW